MNEGRGGSSNRNRFQEYAQKSSGAVTVGLKMNKAMAAGIFLMLAPIIILLGGWILGAGYGPTVILCALCLMAAYPLIWLGMAGKNQKPPE